MKYCFVNMNVLAYAFLIKNEYSIVVCLCFVSFRSFVIIYQLQDIVVFVPYEVVVVVVVLGMYLYDLLILL